MSPISKQTITALMTRSAEKYADRPALGWVDETPATYAQISEQAGKLAHMLQEEGIHHGDRVAILGENHPNWGIAFFGVLRAGAVVVPILPDFHDSEIHHILRHAGCRAVFVSEKLFDKLGDETFESLKITILLDTFQPIPPRTSGSRLKEIIQTGEKEFARLKASAWKLAGRDLPEVQEDDLASIIYTSGTTGHSKGVMLTHRNIVSDILNTLKIQDVGPDDRLLSVLPLSHTYENTIGFLLPIMQGASVAYLRKPPVARVLLPAMEKIKPTMMLTVPLIMEKIFKSKILPQLTASRLMRILYRIPMVRKRLHRIAGKKLYRTFGGNLHFFGIGGAKLAPDVERFLREAEFPYAVGYGLTETSPLIAGSSPDKTRFRSTGPPIPGVEVRIDRPDALTGHGEIQVRGENVMKGYYKDKERTREAFSEDGWFRTGDLGMLDEDGYLFIQGRTKNMILGPSGENIYPEEIEARINAHNRVLESLVYDDNGQLAARIHLNYEELEREGFGHGSESKAAERIQHLLEEIREEVNASASSFSRLKKVIEQPEPFEKTPTKKIKRYLYINP